MDRIERRTKAFDRRRLGEAHLDQHASGEVEVVPQALNGE